MSDTNVSSASDTMLQNQASIGGIIEHSFGIPLEELLAPIGEREVGENVRHNGVYFNIKKARQQDDPTLPAGVWTHELKIADWHKVRQVALDALCHKSKDLQLGVWLFEANIHLQRFHGIAPASYLIIQLCENYWDDMHPQIQDGDIEYRTNPISWLDQKVAPQIRMLPLTKANLDGEEYNWSDWENALRNEQLKSQNKLPVKWDGLTPAGFKKRLIATNSDFIRSEALSLLEALDAMKTMQQWFDETCGNQSPNLRNLIRLLTDINGMFSEELKRRGIQLSASNNSDSSENDQGGDSEGATPPGGASGGGNPDDINSREDAFACLQKAAEFLIADDPHSPVPYLVLQACDWGQYSAPELYQQLFLQQGGQLNIFELMGLEVEQGVQR